jgi:hypothetical protein
MTGFNIFVSESGFLQVHIVSRPEESRQRPYEDWIVVNVRLGVGGFRGSFAAYFESRDFVQLRADLKKLYKNLNGSALFEPIEGQLMMKIEGDGQGHFEAQCVAVDRAENGNELKFILQFDQTYIPNVLNDLDETIQMFRAKGN